jgi:hypothetical protein
MPFFLAERARSECARSTRAIKGSLGRSLDGGLEIAEPSSWLKARLDVPLDEPGEKDTHWETIWLVLKREHTGAPLSHRVYGPSIVYSQAD